MTPGECEGHGIKPFTLGFLRYVSGLRISNRECKEGEDESDASGGVGGWPDTDGRGCRKAKAGRGTGARAGACSGRDADGAELVSHDTPEERRAAVTCDSGA